MSFFNICLVVLLLRSFGVGGYFGWISLGFYVGDKFLDFCFKISTSEPPVDGSKAMRVSAGHCWPRERVVCPHGCCLPLLPLVLVWWERGEAGAASASGSPRPAL